MKSKETSTVNGEQKNTNGIVFSLCHTTARLPDGWREAIQMWKDRADHPELVEHVLVMDEPILYQKIFENTVYGVNDKRMCCVDGWNLAAKLSTGRFLINVADDLFPPEHWDTLLLQTLDSLSSHGQHWTNKEIALDVETGAPTWTAAGSGLITFCFITRKYYERYGYLLYPEYISVYSDNDFTDQARRDDVVVDAKHIKFEHRHPIYNKNVKTDAVYEGQSSEEAWKVGREVYIKRSQSRGFGVKRSITVCLPGNNYSSTWVSMWTELLNNMLKFFDVNPVFCYSTNVHVTRAAMANAVVQSKPSSDYVLWIDDDNLLSFPQLVTMVKDLEDHPEAGSVSAWTWIETDVLSSPVRPSVGMFDGRGDCKAFPVELMLSQDEPYVFEVDWTGFPAILMRHEAIVKAGGHRAFQPYPAPGHPYGFYGEDSSFCINAKNNGVRMFVDKRLKVPHLKLRDVNNTILPTVAMSAAEHFKAQESAANV